MYIRLSQTCSILREVVGHYCFLLLDQEDMETIENWKKSGRKLVQLSLVIKGQGSKERIDKAICKMVSILEEIDLVNVVKLNIDIHGYSNIESNLKEYFFKLSLFLKNIRKCEVIINKDVNKDTICMVDLNMILNFTKFNYAKDLILRLPNIRVDIG